MNDKTVTKKEVAKKDDFLDSINAPVKKLDIEGVSENDIWNLMEKADASQLQPITGSYLTMEVNERKVFKFVAMTTFEGDRGHVDAVQLIDRNGHSFTSANMMLVQSLKRVTVYPAMCRITYLGKKQGKSNEYDNYIIEILPQELAR